MAGVVSPLVGIGTHYFLDILASEGKEKKTMREFIFKNYPNFIQYTLLRQLKSKGNINYL